MLLLLLVLMHEVLCPAIGLCRRSPEELLRRVRVKMAHRVARNRLGLLSKGSTAEIRLRGA